MSTTIRRRNGGYFSMPNRWVEAGYMAAAPGSVTQVYLHLSRWSDNDTWESAQPMRLIAAKCGITEDVARKAVRILEAWGVITREPGSGRSAVNVWYLNDLAAHAPEYPGKVPPKQNGGPSETAPPQNTTPYQPEEIKESPNGDSSGTDTPPKKTGDSRRRDTDGGTSKTKELAPDERLLQVWAEAVNDGRWPVDVAMARKHLKKLVSAGFDEAETRDLIRWAQGLDWRTSGITVPFMVSQADNYRTAKREGKTVRRKADAKGGLVLG